MAYDRNKHIEDCCVKRIAWPPTGKARREWEAHGLKCATVMGFSSICGYVHVGPDHPAAGAFYADSVLESIDVHGGLTFCCRDNDGGSWFGFDCSHYGDGAHHESEMAKAGTDSYLQGEVWNDACVEAETERLAKQLASIRHDVPVIPVGAPGSDARKEQDAMLAARKGEGE